MFGLAQAGDADGAPRPRPHCAGVDGRGDAGVATGVGARSGLHLSLAAMAILVHPSAPRGLVAQSWRVSFGTLPIVLVHFGQASLIGVAANVIAVPVFTLWVLPLGIAGMVAAQWWGRRRCGRRRSAGR